MDFVRINLGNGRNISFWNDHWIGDGLLRDIFPRLFALEGNKLATVNSKIEDGGLINSFRRHPRSGVELTQLNALSDMVVSVNLRPCSDRWVWGLEGSGDFTVASIRREIDDKRFLYVNSKTRWIKAIPIKVNIFAWKVKIDALPTRLNISRRGITLDSILCPICDCGAESTNHLFFECSLAGHLARLISKWWDTPYLKVILTNHEEEEDELSVEDNNDGRINDLEANNGIDESDVEEVLETLFDQPDDQKDKHSEDPFGLYPLLNKENIELA
ncbi:RNA-directed DNA polymerase, eukaryota [Tanacetum coccineum]|uniref:RNA-directed DNA polymerase, eukaryota n=1 Tax=Tanacetum coccineum TaxID=301880 RepID=A0ABQ5HBV3_9ASTR